MTDERPVCLPEGEYAKYLANLAAEIADQKVKSRETRWRALVGIVFTALAVFGFANFSSVANELDAKIRTAEARLSARVDQQIPGEVRSYIENHRSEVVGKTVAELQADLEARLALLQLVITASEMRQGTGFTNETRTAVVELLRTVSQNDHLVQSAQFSKPLEDIVDAFLAADQETYIDDIDRKLRTVVSNRLGITESMLQHYGLRVLGSVHVNESDVERLQHYAEAASGSFNSPEMAAPWLLGLTFVRAGHKKDANGEAIFQDAKHWEEEDRIRFLELMEILAKGKFYRAPSGKTDRVVAVMSQTSSAYEKELAALSTEPPDAVNVANEMREGDSMASTLSEVLEGIERTRDAN